MAGESGQASGPPRVRDADGWLLSEGSRCRRFTKGGRRIKGQVVVTGIREDGNVDTEDMRNLNKGVYAPGQLRLIAPPKETPGHVLRYQLDRETSRLASEISKKQRKVGSRKK